jgi:hypothetical protein
MDKDDPNLDIAIVLGNNIRKQAEFSGKSNNKVMLYYVI